MDEPADYEAWKAWARAQDERSGADEWKRRESCSLYDYSVIRLRYDELVDIRASGNLTRLLYYLNEGVHGNMGGMGTPALYTRALFGTKELITNYVSELVQALRDLEHADEDRIGFRDKIAYFNRASDCFGRSAMMLSGAGTLGAFHVGVAKALAEQDLIPTVVSGASAGSMVAGIIGTHRTEELPALFDPKSIAAHFDALRDPGEVSGRRRRLRVDDIRGLIEATIPDMTFIEAFEETGRNINVSVAPAKHHQRSRLLNASTAPNAFIREAVEASCAIPGMFPPVTLAARGPSGTRQPYVPSRQWIDGSITDDLPARRLARLYGVNHFITSQANPISLFAVRDPHAPDNMLTRLTSIYWSASRDFVRTVYPFVMGLVRDIHPVSTYTRFLFSVMSQDYDADINIMLRHRFLDPTMLLDRLTPKEAEELAREGEQAAWPRIEMIRNCTEVSRYIEGARRRLQERATSAEVAAHDAAGAA